MNHVYGVVGILGVVVAIGTSFVQNPIISEWIVGGSGWLAVLIIGLWTYFSMQSICKKAQDNINNLTNTVNKHHESNQEIEKKYRSLHTNFMLLKKEKENIEATLYYITVYMGQSDDLKPSEAIPRKSPSEKNV